MFRRFHEKLREREEGFTLIELLVVILIIAILAAIAIPVFLHQRQKGWTAQTQSALKNAATAVESFATQNNGDYSPLQGESCTVSGGATTCTGASGTGTNLATDQGYAGTVNVTVKVTKATSSGYCIDGVNSNNPSDTWHYDSNVGAPQSGVC